MLGAIGPLIQLLVILLPELIKLANSFKKTPQEQREQWLAEVRAAMNAAQTKLGNTKPIEDIINNG